MIEYTKEHRLKVFTAFSGYDSQCLALNRLRDTYPDFDYELVGWSEIDKYAIQAHNAIFPEASDKNHGDISKIAPDALPDFDLFTYSFPCTDISAAGQQKGLAEGGGTRSGLLWECRKIIQAKRPKYLLMENVKALLQEKFIGEYRKWEKELLSMGYKTFTQVLNAKDYQVPQNRERVFAVSILDENAMYHFPKPFALTRRIRDVLEDNVAENYYLSDERLAGLSLSTQKESDRGNGFKFEPREADSIAPTVKTSGSSRKTDNYVKEESWHTEE